jgi:hypothetical protein
MAAFGEVLLAGGRVPEPCRMHVGRVTIYIYMDSHNETLYREINKMPFFKKWRTGR